MKAILTHGSDSASSGLPPPPALRKEVVIVDHVKYPFFSADLQRREAGMQLEPASWSKVQEFREDGVYLVGF